MKKFQFWILLLGSACVSALMIKQISLSKAVIAEQRILVDDTETASKDQAFLNTWRQLAVHIYQASREDPDLAAVLTNENVRVGTTPPPPPQPPPSALSSKTPAPSQQANKIQH